MTIKSPFKTDKINLGSDVQRRVIPCICPKIKRSKGDYDLCDDAFDNFINGIDDVLRNNLLQDIIDQTKSNL